MAVNGQMLHLLYDHTEISDLVSIQSNQEIIKLSANIVWQDNV